MSRRDALRKVHILPLIRKVMLDYNIEGVSESYVWRILSVFGVSRIGILDK